MRSVILNTQSPICSVSGGDYHVSTLLNGGSATIQIKPDSVAEFMDFENNVMVDSTTVLMDLPPCEVKLVMTGSPVVTLTHSDA